MRLPRFARKDQSDSEKALVSHQASLTNQMAGAKLIVVFRCIIYDFRRELSG